MAVSVGNAGHFFKRIESDRVFLMDDMLVFYTLITGKREAWINFKGGNYNGSYRIK